MRNPPLATNTLTWGRGRTYFAEAEGLPLSLKCVANGRARYVVGRREIAVDDRGWLVVNADQPYSIEIDSPTLVNTFIIWFPRGWAQEVWHAAVTPDKALLAQPDGQKPAPLFSQNYIPNDAILAPAAHALREAFYLGQPLEDAWLEERLRGILARMLDAEYELSRIASRLPAVQMATREELRRRLMLARDFVHARSGASVKLTDVASAAAMSPYHLLRRFKEAFGQTPHAWLTHCRIERAKFLLARTELPVTDICLDIGYEGLGSFSTSFKKSTGLSPSQWRQRHGARPAIRKIREVSPESDVLLSQDEHPFPRFVGPRPNRHHRQ